MCEREINMQYVKRKVLVCACIVYMHSCMCMKNIIVLCYSLHTLCFSEKPPSPSEDVHGSSALQGIDHLCQYVGFTSTF